MASGEHFAANARCADQDIETNSFGCFQEPSILQSRQISEASGLALVTGKQKPQPLVHALVNQQPHQTRASRSCLASSRASTASVPK
jgi:hypothetical protein